MSTNTRPLVLTVTEVGLILGVSRSTAYELVRSGELESIRLRRWRNASVCRSTTRWRRWIAMRL